MNILTKSITVFTLLLLTFGACDLTNLDSADNPNALKESDGQVGLYLNGVQTDFGSFITFAERKPSQTVRMLNMSGRIYKNTYAPANFNTEWRTAYRSILKNIRELTPLAEKAEFYLHIGISQVIEAYTIIVLVDLFGDVPYTEALNGKNLDPKLDKGRSVYVAAIALLDKAIVNFGKSKEAKSVPKDLFYGENWDNWIKAANSIKMRAYVAMRLVDTQAKAKFDAIVQSGNFIQNNEEDFQFDWTMSNANPDSRHPDYVENYTLSGANTYMSDWFMNYMYRDKTNNGNTTFEGPDPRMKYYFYRQTDEIPNKPNLKKCLVEDRPRHYGQDVVYCKLPEGYWGRDHGDIRGIPPDSQDRTAYGLYPVGGRFDDDSFQPIESISVGAGGAGITPLMLASWIDIMRAEMSLQEGAVGEATIHLQSGVRKSFQKVRAFIGRDPAADLSKRPDPALDEAYVDELGTLFGNAVNDAVRWDILGSEYFVTLFGNGLEAFNFYRRTGRPSTLQPNLEREPGRFFRSFLYPANAAERNSNITQKKSVTESVFWDTGVTLEAN